MGSFQFSVVSFQSADQELKTDNSYRGRTVSPDASAEIARLREEIRCHDRKYYVEAAPEITDLQYDRLMQRLKKLEAEHSKLVTPDSPTQRIGDRPVDGLVPVEHRVPMLSIENTYSLDELKKYGGRVAKLLPDEQVEWVVELKVDGVAVSLIYEDGLLTHGVTGTPEELIIDFGLNPQPFGMPTHPIPVTQRIITNFYTAKRMLHALQLTIQRHEATFGVLETDVQKRVRPGAMGQQAQG